MSVILSDPKLFVVLVVLSVPAYVLIWRTFFGGWDDFTEALYYLVSPRWLAWLRGELVEDSWAHVQLLFFARLSRGRAWRVRCPAQVSPGTRVRRAAIVAVARPLLGLCWVVVLLTSGLMVAPTAAQDHQRAPIPPAAAEGGSRT